MTETTRTIFDKYQVRKSKKQKAAFIEYVENVAKSYGYGVKLEKGYFGAKNIVVGDVENAKVIYTAHYDTCARLPVPNFITPKNVSIYILYQLLFTAAFLLFWLLTCAVVFIAITAVCLISGAEDFPAVLFFWISLLLLYLELDLLMSGPANKHTANDNTSGVTTLLDIIADIPEEDRGKAAFVFFDLEETGLMGSAGFASRHKREMKEKLLVNFDCVSDGDNVIVSVKKKAKAYEELLSSCFESKTLNVEVLTKGVFNPSDQMSFPLGVGVMALKKSKKFGILYLDKIHTKKDTVYKEENIEFLKNGALKLVSKLN